MSRGESRNLSVTKANASLSGLMSAHFLQFSTRCFAMRMLIGAENSSRSGGKAPVRVVQGR